jgi:hypothetical protein
MKKQLAVFILSTLIPAAAMAADTFTGASVGTNIETTKYKIKNSISGENTRNAVLKGDVGFDMGNNLVGAVEAKANLNKSDAFDTNGVKISQKDKYSIGYQQGYRVTKDLMPYAKAEYINSKFDDARANGYGVGMGAKYAVTDNVELGAEYVHSRLKGNGSASDLKLRGNTVSAGVAYRFK